MTKNTISKYVEASFGKNAWFAIPAGIFQGEIGATGRETENGYETFELRGAYYFTGDVRLIVGDMTINIDTIVAWGTRNPSLQNRFED